MLITEASPSGALMSEARVKQLIAACVLVDADGRILLAQRPDDKIMGGLWEFPGGKVNTDETPEAALIRELDEELGIDTYESCLAPLSFCTYPYETFDLILLLYVCRRWQGRPEPIEGGSLSWVKPVRLRDYEMPPANASLIAAIQDLL